MNILIVGCGRVGANLAHILEQLGHQVSVLADDPAQLERLDSFDGAPFGGVTCAGIPIDTDTLRAAGIETCDAVALVTPDDSVNVMTAQIARDIFKVQRVVVRITDPALKDFFAREYGLNAVCPTNLSTQGMLAGLLEGRQSSTLAFGSSTAAFFAQPAPPALLGRPVSRVRAPRGEAVLGVLRKNGTLELAGHPSPLLQEGDQVVFARIAD